MENDDELLYLMRRTQTDIHTIRNWVNFFGSVVAFVAFIALFIFLKGCVGL